jgi:hypothetical protein
MPIIILCHCVSERVGFGLAFFARVEDNCYHIFTSMNCNAARERKNAEMKIMPDENQHAVQVSSQANHNPTLDDHEL